MMSGKSTEKHSFPDPVSEDSGDSRPYFMIRRYPAKEKIERKFIADSHIVFFLSGRVKAVCLGSQIKEFKAGSVFLLPKFSCIFGLALEDCEFIVSRIPEDAERYDRFSKLMTHYSFPPDFRYDFDSLPIVPMLDRYLGLLKMAIEEGIAADAAYQRLKLDELGMYFKCLYGIESLARFFYPLIGIQLLSFRKYVLSNYRSYEDVSSFASSAGMSLSTFSRCFKSAFGTTVYKWLDDRKAENIFRDIVMTDMSFSEIADKHGFSSQAYLVYYTKKHFFLTPSAIRKSFDWGV